MDCLLLPFISAFLPCSPCLRQWCYQSEKMVSLGPRWTRVAVWSNLIKSDLHDADKPTQICHMPPLAPNRKEEVRVPPTAPSSIRDPSSSTDFEHLNYRSALFRRYLILHRKDGINYSLDERWLRGRVPISDVDDERYPADCNDSLLSY